MTFAPRPRLDDDPREVARVIAGAVDVILAESAWLDIARRAQPAQWSDALDRVRHIRNATALLIRYLPTADRHSTGQWVTAAATADDILDRLGHADAPDDYQSAGR